MFAVTVIILRKIKGVQKQTVYMKMRNEIFSKS